ncbi:MAG: hypothetical protein ACR2OG_04915 [Gemmatimonadaceae bacterium]
MARAAIVSFGVLLFSHAAVAQLSPVPSGIRVARSSRAFASARLTPVLQRDFEAEDGAVLGILVGGAVGFVVAAAIACQHLNREKACPAAALDYGIPAGTLIGAIAGASGTHSSECAPSQRFSKVTAGALLGSIPGAYLIAKQKDLGVLVAPLGQLLGVSVASARCRGS